MPPPFDPTAWLNECIRPHEFMLRCWLKNYFPADTDVDDIIQEAYLRVLKARETQPIDSPKAFVFAVAKNVALGRLRRREVMAQDQLTEIDAESILDEETNVRQEVARAEDLELLTLAIQSLPTRCRQILTLRKIYGLSQKEVAAQLGIAEHTVEAQGTIGLRKLTEYFDRVDRTRRAHP